MLVNFGANALVTFAFSPLEVRKIKDLSNFRAMFPLMILYKTVMVGNFVIGLQALLGAGILFYVFGVMAVVSLGFIFFVVPETKGLTLEEIEANCL